MPREPNSAIGLPSEVRDLGRKIAAHGRKAKLDLSPELVSALEVYLSVLLRWNAKINLTGVGTIDEAIDRLVVEAVAAAGVIRPDVVSLIDLGSGGGSPAIPLKLARPQVRLWMVESKGRKAAFLRECARELGLKDTTIEHARAEELLANPSITESMDYCSVRAVRIDGKFLNTIQAFLRPRGQLLLFGGSTGQRLMQIPGFSLVAHRELVGRTGSTLLVLEKA